MALVSKAELIDRAIRGQVVSFPTDTVPALAVKPEQAQLIYQLKQRSFKKPLILMAASVADLEPYIEQSCQAKSGWKAIAKKYWPGALTMVLEASELVPQMLNQTNTKTIGIRIPNHSQTQSVLQQTGVMATTSANISGQNALLTSKEIEEIFTEIAILEDTSPTKPQGSNLPSTIVQWQNAKNWQILRQGSVLFAE